MGMKLLFLLFSSYCFFFPLSDRIFLVNFFSLLFARFFLLFALELDLGVLPHILKLVAEDVDIGLGCCHQMEVILKLLLCNAFTFGTVVGHDDLLDVAEHFGGRIDLISDKF